MKKITPIFIFCLILSAIGCGHFQTAGVESDTGLGTDPYAIGSTQTHTKLNAINNAINDNDTRLDDFEGYLSGTTWKHENGGIEADISGYSGLIGISGGAASEVDTAAELESIAGLGAFFNEYADDADASTMRTTLGLAIGTDVLAPDGDGSSLTGISGTISDNDDLPDDDTDNDLVDWDIIQQVAQNPLSSAPGTPFNGQIECADGDNWQPGSTDQGTDDWIVIYRSSDTTWVGIYNVTDGEFIMQENVYFCVACSDESTDLTTGTAKRTFRMPYAMTLSEVRASVNTAPVGSTLTVDVNEGGTTILSTKLTIDASEKTSTTAATAAVISDSALADDGEITVDVDQIGSSTAGKGLKVCFGGTRP